MRGFALAPELEELRARGRAARPQRAGAERPRARGGRALARTRCSPCSTASRSAASTSPRRSAASTPGCSPRSWCSRRWPPPTPAACRPPIGRASPPVPSSPVPIAALAGRGGGGVPRRLGATAPSRSSIPSTAPTVLDWAPGWPALRWVWAMEGDTLRLLEVTGQPEPVTVARLPGVGRRRPSRSPPRPSAGSWELSPWTALGGAGPGPAVGRGGRRRRRPARARRDDRATRPSGSCSASRSPTTRATPSTSPTPRPACTAPGWSVRDAAAAFDGDEPDAGVLGDAGVAGDDGGRLTWRPTSASSCSAATASSSTTSPRSASARPAC